MPALAPVDSPSLLPPLPPFAEVGLAAVADALPEGTDESDAVGVCENIEEKTEASVIVFVKVYVVTSSELFTGNVAMPVVVKTVYVVPSWLLAAEEVSFVTLAMSEPVSDLQDCCQITQRNRRTAIAGKIAYHFLCVCTRT